jgi:hypothetical protein
MSFAQQTFASGVTIVGHVVSLSAHRQQVKPGSIGAISMV